MYVLMISSSSGKVTADAAIGIVTAMRNVGVFQVANAAVVTEMIAIRIFDAF